VQALDMRTRDLTLKWWVSPAVFNAARTFEGRGDTESIEGTGNNPWVTDQGVGSFDECRRGGHIRG